MDPRADLDVMENKKNLCQQQESNLRFWTFQTPKLIKYRKRNNVNTVYFRLSGLRIICERTPVAND